jgi:hypothetical protein
MSQSAIEVLLRACGQHDGCWQGEIARLRNAANKAAAHAADPLSRKVSGQDHLIVAYRDVVAAHAQLLGVYVFLFRCLRDGDIHVPPALIFDPLAQVELDELPDADRKRIRLVARGLDARYERLSRLALLKLQADLAAVQRREP